MVRIAGSQVEVVQDDGHGGAAVPVQVRHQVQDLHLMRQVKVRGGFIQQQDVRFLCQGHGDPDPLPLAAGQFVHVAAGEVKRSGGFQRALHREIVWGQVPCSPAPEEALVRVASAAHQVADGDAVRGGGVLGKQAERPGQFARRL
jgi:hypothetical protein